MRIAPRRIALAPLSATMPERPWPKRAARIRTAGRPGGACEKGPWPARGVQMHCRGRLRLRMCTTKGVQLRCPGRPRAQMRPAKE